MTRGFRTAATTAAVLVAWLAAAAGRQMTPEVELRQAIDLETVKGDVKGAILQYRAIGDRYHKTHRVVAAQAFLRLAQLLERQGNEEAQRVYARIVSDFAEQPSAGVARARLTPPPRAGSISPTAGKSAKALRLVYSGSSQGQVSPDGRYLAHGNSPLGGKLIVRELKTNQETSYDLTSFEVAFSRDSSRIAYGRCEANRQCEVRVVRLGMSESPRTVFKVDGAYAGVMDWSPDDQSLAIFVNRQSDRVLQFGFLELATGTLRVLKTVNWGGGAIDGVFSPDGRDIAVNVRVADNAGKRDIYLMAVDATSEVPVVTGPSDEFVLGWTSDRKHLLYGSDSQGSIAVWAQAMAARKPYGGPKLLAASIGTDVARGGLTQTGSLHLGVRARTTTAEVVPIDLETGKTTGAASQPIRTVADYHQAPEWSRDGKSLSYFMSRHGEQLVGIHSVDTGLDREIKLGSALDRIASYVSWAPDGSLVAYGRDLKGRYGVFRIEPKDGRVTPLVFRGPEGRAGVEGFSWSPDGTKMYYRAATGGVGSIIERDVASGSERTVVEGQFRAMSLSPDGRWFAVTSGQTLVAIAVADGERRELLTGTFAGTAVWTPDAKSVIVPRAITEGMSQAVLVPLDGSAPRRLDFNGTGLRLNPDGQSVVYTTGEVRAEVWALENFLSTLRAQ